MSIQSALMKSSARIYRSLFDLSVKTKGREVVTVHFKITEDRYENETFEIISEKSTISIIKYPVDVPLERYRSDQFSLAVSSSKEFFYQLLPIELYTQFKDDVEKGDYLIHFLSDEQGRKSPIILRVSETLGRFTTEIVWKKQYCSPFKGVLPEQLKARIEVLLNEDR